MNTTTCNYRSFYTDSGDRGADMCEHNRNSHPDHEHVWGDSPYAHEQIGTGTYVEDPDNFPRTMRVLRTAPAVRCQVCAVRPEDVRVCR